MYNMPPNANVQQQAPSPIFTPPAQTQLPPQPVLVSAAHTALTFEEYSSYLKISMKPTKIVFTTVSILFLVCTGFALLSANRDPFLLFSFLIMSALFAILAFTCNAKSKQKKSYEEYQKFFQNGQSVYFYNTYIASTSQSPLYTEELQADYSSIRNVIETDQFFYIGITFTAVLIVSKQSFTQGNPNDLGTFFKSFLPPAKYKKY